MFWIKKGSLCALCAMTIFAASAAHAQYAAEVISFTSGSSAAVGYDDSSVALGEPERVTGELIGFPGVVSPFNPLFGTDEMVSIGEGGQLTLKLSHFVLPQVGELVLGVFVNAGLADQDYPNGLAGSSLSETENTFGIDSAIVEVSADNITYVPLSNDYLLNI